MSFKQVENIIKQENIKKFLKLSESLDDLYLIDRKRLSDEWIKFNTDLGKSIVELYQFSFNLYKENNLTYKEARFYSFYFDFLVSKPSNSIFTETPKEVKLDLFARSAKKISLLSEHILNLTKNINIKNNDNFNKHFQELFTNIFSYFDFIFDKEIGVFSKFDTNKTLFKIQKEYLELLVNNKEKQNITNVKKILQNIIVKNIELSTKFFKDNTSNEDIPTKDIFKNYVNYQKNEKNNPIVFEIFSYVLASKLWKFIKILQRQPEYKNITDLENVNSKFVENIIEYIKDYLELTDSFYNSKITLHQYYLKIHHIDYEFINEYLFKEILKDISNDLNQIKKLDINNLWTNNEEIISSKNLKKLLKPIINNNSAEKFKLYRFIRESNFKEISLLIDILHFHILELNNNKLDNIEYIGVLRSGSFLAHALNILKCYENNNDNTRVVSLLTHPYLSILPRTFSERKNNEDNKRFIYIDEAIKSGYGLSISDIYRNKILTLSKKTKSEDDSAVAIANMHEYTKNQLLNKISYSSIIDVERTSNKESLYFKDNDTDILIKKQFNWLDFINNLNIIDQNELKSIANTKDNKQLDITKIISDSILLFQIANDMSVKIYQNLQETQDILFYSGSTEGSLLIDVLTFVYKIKYGNNKNFYINAKTIKDAEVNKLKTSKNIFIDITIDSGNTKENVFNLDVHKELKNTELNDFDLSLFIFGRENKKLNKKYNLYIAKIED